MDEIADGVQLRHPRTVKTAKAIGGMAARTAGRVVSGAAKTAKKIVKGFSG